MAETYGDAGNLTQSAVAQIYNFRKSSQARMSKLCLA